MRRVLFACDFLSRPSARHAKPNMHTHAVRFVAGSKAHVPLSTVISGDARISDAAGIPCHYDCTLGRCADHHRSTYAAARRNLTRGRNTRLTLVPGRHSCGAIPQRAFVRSHDPVRKVAFGIMPRRPGGRGAAAARRRGEQDGSRASAARPWRATTCCAGGSRLRSNAAAPA
jgi:hypothetical protein